MYHVGKVLTVLSSGKEVLASDDSTQLLLEMWDKNILTFTIEPKLAKQVKKEDFVLVDYTPISEKMPVPRHLVVKILRGKIGEDTWKHYKKFFNDKQVAATQQMPQGMSPQYFG